MYIGNQNPGYSGSFNAVPTGAGTDKIFYENGKFITQNYALALGANAMTAGPIEIAAGVTVTVSSGSTWTIV